MTCELLDVVVVVLFDYCGCSIVVIVVLQMVW